MSHILIIGGGISGLVSAYSELKKGNQVTLKEEKDRLGGMLHTLTTPYGLVETAANGLLNSAKVEQLIEDLGLQITYHNKASKRRYFYINGKLRRLPISWKSGIRGLAGFFFKNAKPLDEETMEEWSNRIFGEEITYNLIEPALGGIYSTPLSKMSPEMVFSNFSLQEDRSFFKAVKSRPKSQKPKIRGLISFQNGMQELVDKLSSFLEKDKNCTIELNTNSINLAKIRSEKIYDAVRICLPIQSAYKLCLLDTASKVFLEKHGIQEPNYHSIATLTRFSEESIFSKPAFGVLFPKNSPIKANGVLSNDSIFPGRTLKEGIFSETWIYSGDWLKDTNEIALQSILEEDRVKLLKKDHMNKSIAMYSKKWIDSFPVYDDNLLNFNACLDEVEEYHSTNHKPVQFYGNYRKGIGLRSLIENALKG